MDMAFGRPAERQQASRVIHVVMTDDVRFVPAEIRVKRGETVRFIVTNNGERAHDVVLGTMASLKKHAAAMHRAHHEPNKAKVAPGQTAEIDWQFTEVGEFYYGSPVPAHFEGRRLGRILVY
ncbi:MAG TPA: plastocyanin/azurin family copper-binding protein [Burkholderiales bacterium]|nr:plastocyanin/azurin family copper-binding protein [Burkholderiales bacterium]